MSNFTVIVGKVRTKLHEMVERVPEGWSIIFCPPKRTLEQNKKMHAMLTDIAKARPEGRVYDTETWKCLVMDDCGFKPKWRPSLDGQSMVNTGYRSSKLTKDKMSEMIERMYAFGAEHGIEWSDEKDIRNVA